MATLETARDVVSEAFGIPARMAAAQLAECDEGALEAIAGAGQIAELDLRRDTIRGALAAARDRRQEQAAEAARAEFARLAAPPALDDEELEREIAAQLDEPPPSAST